ncbi:hypothetical protein L7F22_026716 [Adiantum nelumboides]|nr:hypothetical protein [Adiantum nelumboides]
MAQKPSHIPKFGNWDPNDHMPYTVVFDNARAGKGGKIINPNDPMESEVFFGKGSDAGSANSGASVESIPRPPVRHQRRASREDSEFGFSNEGFNSGHGQKSSRGDEDFSQIENGSNHDRASMGSGVSPMHPQAYGGRLGRKPGSASPAVDRKPDGVAPGTPNRNRQPERYAAPLPKFGDWDVNNPSAGEGFTVIFDKARDEKKTGGALRIQDSPLRPEQDAAKSQPGTHKSSNWFCRCFHPSTA